MQINFLLKNNPEAKFILGDGSNSWWSEIFENNKSIIKANDINKYSNEFDATNQEYLAAIEENDILNKYNQLEDIIQKKNQARIRLATIGTISIGIWIWNIIDINKAIKKETNLLDKMDMGLNETGQLEIRFAF